MIEALASASSHEAQAPAISRLLAAVVGVLQEEAELAAHQGLPRRQGTIVRVLRGLFGAPGSGATIEDALSVLLGVLVSPELPPHSPAAEAGAWTRDEARASLTQHVCEQAALRGEAAQCLLELLCGRVALAAGLPPGTATQAAELLLRALGLEARAAAPSSSDPAAAVVAAAAAGGELRKRPRLEESGSEGPKAADSALSATVPTPSALVFGALCGLKLIAAAAPAEASLRAVSGAAAAWADADWGREGGQGVGDGSGAAGFIAGLWAPHCIQQAEAAARALASGALVNTPGR